MRTHTWIWPAGAFLALLVHGQMAAFEPWRGPTTPSLALGERMYRQGILPTGQPMPATVLGDVAVTGTQLRCVSCHRRSGFGTTEARAFIPPITAAALFEPMRLRSPATTRIRVPESITRPAYTEATLAQAIRAGIDPAGRPLTPLMPRYPLSDEAMGPLLVYLKQLGTDQAPGVTEDTVSFATVVTEGVAPAQRSAMLNVLQAYVQDKNAETRHEEKRRRAAPWTEERMVRAYRRWDLHVWELTGSPATWPRQLAAYYQTQPVFALISGISDLSWQPIHDFCEHFAIPCLFPNTDMPSTAGEHVFSLYFSQGLRLEARALAKFLHDQGEVSAAAVIVGVYRDTERSAQPAHAMQHSLRELGFTHIRLRKIPETEPLTAAFWNRLVAEEHPTVLVPWVDETDLPSLAAVIEQWQTVQAIFFSSTLLEVAANAISGAVREKIYFMHPYRLPAQAAQPLTRAQAWFQARHLAMHDARVQGNTFFAVTVAADAFTHLLGYFSREYFLERLEHAVGKMPFMGVYPRLSLGPDQRFASTGCYVVQLAMAPGQEIRAVSDWIIP